MPTKKKIPKKFRKTRPIAIGPYCVFTQSILTAANVSSKLSKADKKEKLPAYGQIQIKGKKYYYCRYGLISKPHIIFSK